MATQSKTPALDVKEELAKLKINNPVKGTVVENAGIREKLGIANHEQLTVATDGVIGDFQSESIVDNATGIDVTGSVTCDGFTSTGIDDNATSTAITITAAEKVGFGDTTPSKIVDIVDTDNSKTAQLRLSDSTNTTSTYLGQFSDGTRLSNNCTYDSGWAADDIAVGVTNVELGTGFVSLSTNPAGNVSATERMRIDSSGNVTVSTGNLVIGTSGKGIDFSADGNASGMTSEVLDDYEEGTFTPTLNDGTNAGTADISSAVYTKVGNRVYVNGWVRLSSLGSMTGASVYLGGLPFTTVGTYYSTLHIGYFTGLAITAGTSLSGYIQPNSTISKILVADLADAISGLSVAELSANGGFMFSAHYTTNS